MCTFDYANLIWWFEILDKIKGQTATNVQWPAIWTSNMDIIVSKLPHTLFVPTRLIDSILASPPPPGGHSHCDLYTMRDHNLSKSNLNTDFTLGNWHPKTCNLVNFDTLSNDFSSCVRFHTLSKEFPVMLYPKQGSLFSYPKQGKIDRKRSCYNTQPVRAHRRLKWVKWFVDFPFYIYGSPRLRGYCTSYPKKLQNFQHLFDKWYMHLIGNCPRNSKIASKLR